MKCSKCGIEIIEKSKFCPECGSNLKELKKYNISNLPKMLTVKESYEIIFMKKLSLSKIYDLIRTRSIPHVNANGKLLLDFDKTVEWWSKKLNDSTVPVKLNGLKRIK